MIKELVFSDKRKAPLLGLGTWKLYKEDCFDTVKNALDLGYRHIDTAEIYMNEEEIGQAIKSFPREELFITSKFWSIDGKVGPGVPHDPSSREFQDVINSCEGSLKRLQTDYLDLYLIHWPNSSLDLEEVFKAFKKLQDDGKIRSFGVSNFTIKHLRRAIPIAEKIGLKIVNNQVEFHPHLFQEELLDFCRKNKIALTAYSPLARGKICEEPELKKIAEKHNRSVPQIVLRWLIQKNIIAIPKASSKEHLKENMDVFDFSLSEEDTEIMDSLNSDDRIIRPDFSDFDD